MICKICGNKKDQRFCKSCNQLTPTAFSKFFTEEIHMNDSVRNLSKSGNKIGNKAKREIEQYVGNKDPLVTSEYERLREFNKPTLVIHRLWRRVGNVFKKVHEHIKSS